MTDTNSVTKERWARESAGQVDVTRRAVLAATGGVVGLAGCSGGSSSENECSETGIVVAAPDGTRHCVAPVESDQSVQAYYGAEGEQTRQAETPTELAVNDATVTVLYHDTSTGDRSLVLIHGDPDTSSDGGGAAVMTFEGVDGYEWRVHDGPPGNDAYKTPDGAFESSESASWSWPDDRSDGGAIGPLGDQFDVELTHRQEGTVNDQSQERSGLDQWLFIDGADRSSPIELANFSEGDPGDVSARLSTTG